MTTEGTCDPRFENVRSLFQHFLDSGEEIGASLAVNVNGEDVVDLCGGHADAARTRPWTRDTIVPVASTTKMISSLAMLLLVDSGAISVRDKVSRHWPAFAANGKEGVEIRHLLSHTSGVAGWDDAMTMDEVCDAGPAAARLARQAPWWEPGTASGYHAWNFGHLLGEVVRRVTGMGLREYVATRVAGPLGADFQIGLADEDEGRLAEFVAAAAPPPPPQEEGSSTGGAAPPKPGALFMKAIGNPVLPPGFSTRLTWKKGEIGASNGYGNARSLNAMLTCVTLAGREGGAGRKVSLSKETVDLIFEEQSRGEDLVVGKKIRFGIGYALRGDGDTWADDWLPAGNIAYWGGSGGSLGIMDVGRGVTITYAMNKRSHEMIGNKASKSYVKAIYEALGIHIE
ncbi:beta-lactamase [Xylariaceae sp. FL0016]|nr:beta-lactamase [Xylariaceae sp. FL0016]